MARVSQTRMIYQTEATRSKILQTARTLFTERGLFDTQMQDVAAALGMSRTTLYRYFQDKLDLALSITAILLSELESSWQDPGEDSGAIPERIAHYLRSVWTNTAQWSGHLRYLAEFDAFFSGARIPPHFREKMQETLARTQQPPLVDLIRAGQARGEIRPDLNPHLTMATVLNAVRGLQQRVLLRGDVLIELDSHEADHLTDELISLLVRSLTVS